MVAATPASEFILYEPRIQTGLHFKLLRFLRQAVRKADKASELLVDVQGGVRVRVAIWPTVEYLRSGMCLVRNQR